MKRVLSIALLFALGVVLSVSAQNVLLSTSFSGSGAVSNSYGDWQMTGGRLYQDSVTNHLAKANFQVPQSGIMEYDFNIRYQAGGFEDHMGGFGIQVFVDQPYSGMSWGNGTSYLLWLNYDEHPTYGGAGFRAQVYKSTSDTDMTLMPGYDIALDPAYLTQQNASTIIPVKITINSNTGEVLVKDPTRDNWEYAFNLGSSLGTGAAIALRTNSLSVSFGDLKVTKIQ
ncbi:MAG TPA: hypothetical protein VMV68_04630 [Spirochaetia bacterium]|nr:hypothetical protein [Spirochaetia bacterium]